MHPKKQVCILQNPTSQAQIQAFQVKEDKFSIRIQNVSCLLNDTLETPSQFMSKVKTKTKLISRSELFQNIIRNLLN